MRPAARCSTRRSAPTGFCPTKNAIGCCAHELPRHREVDRKSTRLNSSHGYISYAVFCLKKKKKVYRLPTDSSSSRPRPRASGRASLSRETRAAEEHVAREKATALCPAGGSSEAYQTGTR